MFSTRTDTLAGGLLGGLERAGDHGPGRDHSDIRAVAQPGGHTVGKRPVSGHRRYFEPADAQEDRRGRCGRPTHRSAGLGRVGRHHDAEAGDRPQPGQVLDRVVGGTEFAVRDAGAHAAEHDRGLAVGDVRLDLLERPAGEERRRRANERHVSAERQPGADADHLLLGDAHVDQPIAGTRGEPPRLLEPTESLQTATIRSSSRASLISSSAKATRQSKSLGPHRVSSASRG